MLRISVPVILTPEAQQRRQERIDEQRRRSEETLAAMRIRFPRLRVEVFATLQETL